MSEHAQGTSPHKHRLQMWGGLDCNQARSPPKDLLGANAAKRQALTTSAPPPPPTQVKDSMGAVAALGTGAFHGARIVSIT